MNYFSGNYYEKPVYLQGEPCSKCEAGEICQENLCAAGILP